MPQAGHPRRLATILFLDIVGSTQIAAEIGDRRWRELLSEFRQIVRTELKRHKGHEEDTAGDGFFATFSQPAEAVRCASAIVRGVQQIGLDVRCGLHFGEAETIQGRRGGMAVHIGSRVMSLAGAAEVLATGTVRDLVVGAEIELVDTGSHELKGIPGPWHVWRVVGVDGAPVAAAIEPVRATELRARRTDAGGQRRPAFLVAAAAAAALFAVAVLIAVITASPPVPTLLRIDPSTNAVTQLVTDSYRSEHLPNALWAVNGALWQGATDGFQGLVRRDMQSGAVLQTIEVNAEPEGGAFGFGSIWIGGLTGQGSIDRWDAVTGRKLASLSIEGEIVSMDAGMTAVWALTQDGRLHEIDPIRTELKASYPTGASDVGVVVALEDHVWVCACEERRLFEFDPAQSRVVRVIETSPKGFLVGLADTQGTKTLWLLDLDGATLTPIDAMSGEPGQPIGIGANLHGAIVAFGSVWVARGDQVIRLRGNGPEVLARIAMPEGMSAGAIAADPDSGALWVGDCGCPIE